MKFRVTILRLAKHDIREIAAWISERSRRGAAAWLAAFEKLVDRLAETAPSFPVAEENDEVEVEIRQGLFKTRRGRVYRAIFTIVGDEVRILRIRGPGQPPLSRSDVES
jgi:plasmid stabilization system protein ParE